MEKFIGVSGEKENLPQLPDSEFLPPMGYYSLEKTIKGRLQKKMPEVTMTMGRVAILTENHNGRVACHYCGPCHRGPLDFFTDVQRAAITTAAELTIPATDTPGAIDAGVPRFIELMVRDWLNDAERGLFMEGLEDLLQRAGGNFAALDTAAQLALLEAFEDEASDDSWYQLGNVTRVWSEGSPFICQFKELTVFGFFLSSTGASEVLRENPMGSFDGDIPLEPGQPAWASESPLRGMTRD